MVDNGPSLLLLSSDLQSSLFDIHTESLPLPASLIFENAE